MILVSGIVSSNITRIREQILLYNAALGGEGECCHIIHINADAVQKGILRELALPDNVIINPEHLYTRRPTFLACHLSNYLHAVRTNTKYSHIYLHTDSDLPYRPGLGEHIRSFDVGALHPKVINLASSSSGWALPVSRDIRLKRFAETWGDGNIYTCRYEGMFATRDIVSDLFAQMLTVWPYDENYWRGDYPYEEYALPTVLAAMLNNRDIKRTRNAVLTGPSTPKYGMKSREVLGEKHIALMKDEDPSIFSVKFAPDDVESPVWQFAKGSLGLGDIQHND